MKNGKLVALLTGVLLVLAGTVYTIKHLRDQEQQAEATYGTEMPRVADIILKTIASGSVQPRQEILIKPQVSGIVRRVLVEAGDAVEAERSCRSHDCSGWRLKQRGVAIGTSAMSLDDAQLNHDRNADLLARGVLAPAEAPRACLETSPRGALRGRGLVRIVQKVSRPGVEAMHPTPS